MGSPAYGIAWFLTRLQRSNNVNDRQMAALAVWISSTARVDDVVAYANSIGIDLDDNDCVTLFHYINDERSNSYEHASTL